MNVVVLDTHVLIWLMAGNARLGTEARRHIQRGAESTGVLVSAITPWEIAMLVSKGRLTLDRDVGEWLQSSLALPGIKLVPLSPEISVASTRLPGKIHGDPADRIIAATARHHGATLVTNDHLLLTYGADGHLRTLPASD